MSSHMQNDTKANANIDAKEETSLLQRIGPSVREYFLEFLDYLKKRTEFRPQHFRAPAELQRTMESMEELSIPMEIWQVCINAAVRLIAINNTDVDINSLVDILISAACVIVEFVTKRLLLRLLFKVIFWLGSKELTAIAICIYHFINFSAEKLWRHVLTKLIDLHKFATKTICNENLSITQ